MIEEEHCRSRTWRQSQERGRRASAIGLTHAVLTLSLRPSLSEKRGCFTSSPSKFSVVISTTFLSPSSALAPRTACSQVIHNVTKSNNTQVCQESWQNPLDSSKLCFTLNMVDLAKHDDKISNICTLVMQGKTFSELKTNLLHLNLSAIKIIVDFHSAKSFKCNQHGMYIYGEWADIR